MLLDALQSQHVITLALEQRFAILAVNADSPAAITDCLEAALQCGAPIMIETSLWQLKGHSFGSGDAALGMARYLVQLGLLAASERYRDVPVFFHTDHIKGPEALPLLKNAIRGLPANIAGIPLLLRPSTVSLDSSEMSELENIRSLCSLCEAAVEAGQALTLEMEAGVDDGVTSLETARALLRPVEERHPGRIWLWAPGVGTQHGFSDKGYPGFSLEAVKAHRELASEIASHPVGIALHGSSGLPEECLRAAVQNGVAKVNWSSESLWLRSRAARDYYAEKGGQLEKKHPGFKNAAMDDGVQRFVSQRYAPKVIERIRILGGEGQAAAAMARVGTA